MTPTHPRDEVPAEPAPDFEIVVAPPSRLRTQHYVWVVAAVVLVAALLHFLGPILTPFLIGAMLAYLGNPAVNWGERHRVPRTVGTLLVMLAVIVLILALLLILSPLVHTEFLQLYQRLPEVAGTLYGQLAPWLSEKFGIELQIDLASIKQLVADNLESAESLTLKLLSGLKTGGTVLLSILINLLLIPVVMFYLLRDWNILIMRID